MRCKLFLVIIYYSTLSICSSLYCQGRDEKFVDVEVPISLFIPVTSLLVEKGINNEDLFDSNFLFSLGGAYTIYPRQKVFGLEFYGTHSIDKNITKKLLTNPNMYNINSLDYTIKNSIFRFSLGFKFAEPDTDKLVRYFITPQIGVIGNKYSLFITSWEHEDPSWEEAEVYSTFDVSIFESKRIRSAYIGGEVGFELRLSNFNNKESSFFEGAYLFSAIRYTRALKAIKYLKKDTSRFYDEEIYNSDKEWFRVGVDDLGIQKMVQVESFIFESIGTQFGFHLRF